MITAALTALIGCFAASYTGVSVYAGYILIKDHRGRLMKIIKSERSMDEIGDLLTDINNEEIE